MSKNSIGADTGGTTSLAASDVSWTFGNSASFAYILDDFQPADAGNANLIDKATRRELLRIDQPQFNHNGGKLAFGWDGYLYVSLGDGGDADDAGGSVLRIVDLCAQRLAGDVNNDCAVNLADLAVVGADWLVSVVR